MPLKLSLKPGEAVVVNGAVLRNGDRRGTLLLENQSRVLREKDIIEPEDAEQPSERAYFAIMQMYLTGRVEGALYDQAASALANVLSTIDNTEVRRLVLDISRSCAAGLTYKAISQCRKLMKLTDVPSGGAYA